MSSTFYVQLLRWYFCTRKLQSQTVTREKLQKAISYKNFWIKCWWNWHLLVSPLIWNVTITNLFRIRKSHLMLECLPESWTDSAKMLMFWTRRCRWFFEAGSLASWESHPPSSSLPTPRPCSCCRSPSSSGSIISFKGKIMSILTSFSKASWSCTVRCHSTNARHSKGMSEKCHVLFEWTQS